MNEKKIRIGIVAAEFNFDLTQAMIKLAEEHAKFLNAEVVDIILVPGCFEIPFACANTIKRKDINGFRFRDPQIKIFAQLIVVPT